MSLQLLSYLGSSLVTGQAVPQVVSAAFPLPVTISGGIGGLNVAGTVADGAAVGAQFPVTAGGVDYATGFIHRLNTDASGRLNVNVITGGGSSNVSGTIANAAAGNPNPVVMGGRDQASGNVYSAQVNSSGLQMMHGLIVSGNSDGGVQNPIVIGGRPSGGSPTVYGIAVNSVGAIATRPGAITNYINYTTTPLGVGGVYSSGSINNSSVSAYADNSYINIGVLTDQAGTLVVNAQPAPGTVQRLISTTAIAANTYTTVRLATIFQLFTVVYTNGGVAQTFFSLAITGAPA